jgi:transposase
MASVIIGMDPHKPSVTIEIMNERENVLLGQRFGTDRDGFKELLRTGRRFPDRTWAIEGCNGIGRHVAQRLVAAGEAVVDVLPKLSARTQVFSTGNGRKTDPVDAHSIALAALRTRDLRVVPDNACAANTASNAATISACSDSVKVLAARSAPSRT